MADREKVLEAIENCIGVPKCRDCPWEDCEGFVRHIEIPESLAKAAYELLKEQEGVVRCKDCKHYMTIHCTCDGCCISDDWFCADGERR